MRVETLRHMKIDPYIMPFNKDDWYQRKMRDYVNCKDLFKSGTTWEQYIAREKKEDGKSQKLGVWMK